MFEAGEYNGCTNIILKIKIYEKFWMSWRTMLMQPSDDESFSLPGGWLWNHEKYLT